MSEHGPFETEKDALSTRAAARIKAAFDANPGVGASTDEALKVMTGACEECGVELGRMDVSTLHDIAWRETFEAVSVAGMIRRAFEAGKAAALPEGTVTEWGVTLEGYGNEPFAAAADEGDARQHAAGFPRSKTEVVCREVTPWTPAPGEDEDCG